MAEKKRASQSTQSQSLAEGVDKELTCAICLSRYNQPKILPCLHSYCKGCLEVMSKKSREEKIITCPQCKEVHEMPPQGIDGFTTFFTVNNLLELLRIHEINDLEKPVPSIKCSSGLNDNCDPAVARCLTCSDYLCESCSTIHRKLKATKDHVVKTFQEIKQSDKKTGVRSLHKQHHCKEHKDKLLELYCKTCKKSICLLCALLTHKQHDYAVIHEIRAATQEQLEGQILGLQKKVIEFQGHQKYTETLVKISNEAAKSAEAKVNQVCGALVQSIEARCAQLIGDIHRIHESEVKQITLESESIAHSLSRFLGSIQFTKQLLDNGDDVEVMDNSIQTTRTLTSLAQLEWDRSMLKPSLLRPEFESSMEKSVNNFGQVLHTIQPEDVIVSNLPTEVLVGKEYSFKVSLSKDVSERGYSTSVEITISHSDTTVLASSVVNKEELNTWCISFTPEKPGVHQISVKVPESSLTLSHTIDVDNLDEPEPQELLWGPGTYSPAHISIAPSGVSIGYDHGVILEELPRSESGEDRSQESESDIYVEPQVQVGGYQLQPQYTPSTFEVHQILPDIQCHVELPRPESGEDTRSQESESDEEPQVQVGGYQLQPQYTPSMFEVHQILPDVHVELPRSESGEDRSQESESDEGPQVQVGGYQLQPQPTPSTIGVPQYHILRALKLPPPPWKT